MSSEPQPLTLGGPLFRNPSTSHSSFSSSWHRHAQIVTPWFLHYQVVDYIQIHLPDPAPTPTPHEPSPANCPSAQDILLQAKALLRQADGVAYVRCAPIALPDGSAKPFGSGPSHPYFRDVVVPDERRFLHAESGASGVRGETPVYHVPGLGAEEWRRLAVEMGGVEFVKIREGKAVVEGVWDAEWIKWNEE
ncbi:hypothetical protein CC78DRAFT_282083 [Lojkania enalia]|uniref:EthD domain-containing protein n=1 Tax=Lojkania enalia TaxID=147567 RepID=A0A9P4NAC1_9PLEO|nr:hypothetical protein CC78DRAFT_282083 [Didymosphaeria enalia]